MKYSIKYLLFSGLFALFVFPVHADEDGKNMFNPLTTGVTTLGIAPDARGGSMGDLGVATDPDVNSQYWNPSKYAFAYSSAGVSVSYTPWLRKLVNDINLAYVAGYWKFGGNDLQALSASLRYFSLGSVPTYDNNGVLQNTVNPYEMAIDLGYSRKLSSSFSMGVVFRFIYSDMGFGGLSSAEDMSGAAAFAADISGYQTVYPIIGRSECQFSWGFNISNIGSKVSYDGGTNSSFLPTNLRLGFSFLFPIYDYNTLSINFDANKLLVPAAPRQSDYTYEDEYGNTQYDTEAYNRAKDKFNNTGSISGIFKSFSDAPGGFKEELREIYFSTGLEYSYNRRFFVRAGYYYENKYKGNRQYATFGAGFSLNVFSLDAAYVLATAQSSPLDQTMRFTLSFDMDGIKDLIGRKRRR
ncbi:MAG TPA: type IX secretion system outer membrane channel protein PorV [Candidatus Caccoplasma intestinavium]|uniref:Type IX secretion system outer membrane channel protein PorV n=1 Tax=Candidatus Caccoplasma intestinavium TaxID=2840716 RepID=A0A9D1GFR1_9BACT|nr:type IX secretion system outer membrane channel protein PorV [Candidatus Caccoplasma intestinavium]